MTTYKQRELHLISEMENRTEYNDGLTIPELCKRVLGYDMQALYGKDKRAKYSVWSKLRDHEEREEVATKCIADKKKANQIRQMIIRTREKYEPGSKYNDTNIKKHQYYLLPPRLQHEDKHWRCVHIIPGINRHLLEPSIIRDEKYISTMERTMRRRRKNVQRSEEEREELYRQEIGRGLFEQKEVKKLVSELKKEKRLPRKYKPDYERIHLIFDTEIDKMMQKYGTEILGIIGYDDGKGKILRDIIIADCEKKQYILKYDWELLDYLKTKKGKEI